MKSANLMKRNLAGFSRQYQAALRRHLERQGRRDGPPRALGRDALAAGFGTLDLARIHEHALATLVLPNHPPATRKGMVRRAGTFFAKVITPIEQTHRTARQADTDLREVMQSLSRRSLDLAAANRQLKQEIRQRKSAEQSLKRSEQHYGQLLEQSRSMQEQLRLLSRQLLLAQEEERKKISRELHDVIGQTLTRINVQLATLKREAASDALGLERSIARTQELVEKSVSIVHRFARELRPTVLDDLGLIPALRTFLKNFREETGIQVSLTAFAAVEQVTGDKRTVLYRVAQEALTNVARHARASLAEVKIQKQDAAVRMEIKDNGKGFREKRVLHSGKSKQLGILGMRERLEMVGGSLAVVSAPGKGTTVLAQIPLMDTPRKGGGGEKLR